MKKKDDRFYADVSNHAGWLRSSFTARQIAVYELFKKTLNLPGSIAEFGVWRGSTFFFLARLIDIFDTSVHENMNLTSRQLFGFDTFEGFVSLSPNDLAGRDHDQKKVGGLNFDNEIFDEAFKNLKDEMKFPSRVNIIRGDVMSTFKPFLDENAGVRFNFVNLDMDLYEPTSFVLNEISVRMVNGGVLLFKIDSIKSMCTA